MTPFFEEFLTHVYLYRRSINREIVHYLAIRMSLNEEFCKEVKLQIKISRDEDFANSSLIFNVSPISSSFKGIDFYVNKNLCPLSESELFRLSTVHAFFFFSVEVTSYGNLPLIFPTLFKN